ncbi:MAG: 50S ribosomal protein L11 methyltransferase [Patulibacter sp.]|nr:50S ribosomal protein L11 methyltransferase [Patulibacter sp.]
MLRRAVRVGREDADVVLARLTELAPLGVEESEVDGLVEFGLYGDADALPAESLLRERLGDALVAVVDRDVADDWDVRWMTFHEPVLIADRLYVRPPWADAYAGDVPGVRDLVIDPAQAFGTGGHETTRLCLELLVALADEGDAGRQATDDADGDPSSAGLEVADGSAGDDADRTRGPVLDLGCGSGVLAVAAALLGWGPVHGVDNEPPSVAATIENAAVNGVTVTAAPYDLLRDGPAGMPADATADGRPPLVLANLLRPLLLRVAGDGFADPQPHAVIASGLLTHEVDGIVRAFAGLGFAEAERRASGDWAAVLLRRG